jgi:hypothetical protein
MKYLKIIILILTLHNNFVCQSNQHNTFDHKQETPNNEFKKLGNLFLDDLHRKINMGFKKLINLAKQDNTTYDTTDKELDQIIDKMNKNTDTLQNRLSRITEKMDSLEVSLARRSAKIAKIKEYVKNTVVNLGGCALLLLIMHKSPKN